MSEQRPDGTVSLAVVVIAVILIALGLAQLVATVAQKVGGGW